MAIGKSSGKRCPECGTEHSVQRGPCDSIELRRGPDVTNPNHPSNNGAWKRTLSALWAHGLPV